MSLRPQMKLIFGIDDLQTKDNTIIDSRYTEKGYTSNDDNYDFVENELPIKWDYDINFLPLFDHSTAPMTPLPLCECLHWEDFEFGIPFIIGLQTSQGMYDDYCLRALAMIDEKYLEPGYQIIPPVDIEKNPNAANIMAKANVNQQHFYKQGFYSDVSQWTSSVQFLFNYIGLKVENNELKWMLYWQWS